MVAYGLVPKKYMERIENKQHASVNFLVRAISLIQRWLYSTYYRMLNKIADEGLVYF